MSREMRPGMIRFGLGAVLLVAGCTVGPNYHRPAAIVPTHYKTLAGWVIATPEAAITRGAWWSIFDDRTLDALESEVDVSNQTIRADVATYAEARALVDEARAGFYPTVSANSGVTRQSGGTVRAGGGGGLSGQPVTETSYTLEGSGAWDLDLWGRVRREVQSSVAAAQISAADLANA
ncbi:MAG: TolC family protein, partial [Acetobacteraceae bacterium]